MKTLYTTILALLLTASASAQINDEQLISDTPYTDLQIMTNDTAPASPLYTRGMWRNAYTLVSGIIDSVYTPPFDSSWLRFDEVPATLSSDQMYHAGEVSIGANVDWHGALNVSGRIDHRFGIDQIAIGARAGHADMLSSVAIGNEAIADVPSDSSVAIGNNALLGTIDAFFPATNRGNVAIGYYALRDAYFANNNTAIGINALRNGIYVENNVAIGHSSLASAANAIGNVGIGYNTLRQTTTGSHNIAIGTSALYSNTDGVYNYGNGFESLYANTEGDFNIGLGWRSLYSNTTGNANVAIGHQALYNSTTAERNVAIGPSALNAATGSGNVAIGAQAGVVSTGSGNVFIGDSVAYSFSGSNRLFIDNSPTASPLLYGNFSADSILVNGKLGFTTTAGTATSITGRNGTQFTNIPDGFGINLTSGVLVADTARSTGLPSKFYVDSLVAAGGGSSDHDFYEVGGSSAPNSINDNIYKLSGNTALGNATPYSKLSVLGDIGSYRDALTSAGDSIGAQFFIGDLNFYSGGYFDKTAGLASIYNSSTGVASDLGLYTYNGTTRVERMRIRSDGKVGIGTNRPQEKLHVLGNATTEGTQNVWGKIDARFPVNTLQNVVIGIGSHSNSMSGDYNTLIGQYSGEDIVTGSYNTFIGGEAGRNYTGDNGVGIGFKAMWTNVSGAGNIAIGDRALRDATVGNNFALGNTSLLKTTTGQYNVGIGNAAMGENLTGQYNLALGTQAGYSGTTGDRNVTLGFQAGYGGAANDADDNVIIGNGAGSSVTGDENVFIGSGTATYSTGSYNTMIGMSSGVNNTGSGNVFIGYTAGYSNTNSNRLIIENSTSSSPLIAGDFAADSVHIHGTLGYATNSGTPTTLSGRYNKKFSDVGTGFGLSLTAGTLLVDSTKVTTPYDISGLMSNFLVSASGTGGTGTVSNGSTVAHTESTGLDITRSSLNLFYSLDLDELLTDNIPEGDEYVVGSDGSTVNEKWPITKFDTSYTNEAWTADADDSDTELIIAQTVKFEGDTGIIVDYDPVNNKFVFDIKGDDFTTVTTPESTDYVLMHDENGASADVSEKILWSDLASLVGGVTDHGALTGLADDDHTQYALLAGRAGGQTLKGGTAASNNLTLMSTNSATKGKIIMGASAYDEGLDRLGIGTTSPTYGVQIVSDAGLAVEASSAGVGQVIKMEGTADGGASPLETSILLNYTDADYASGVEQNAVEIGLYKYSDAAQLSVLKTTMKENDDAEAIVIEKNASWDAAKTTESHIAFNGGVAFTQNYDISTSGNLTIDRSYRTLNITGGATTDTIKLPEVSTSDGGGLPLDNWDSGLTSAQAQVGQEFVITNFRATDIRVAAHNPTSGNSDLINSQVNTTGFSMFAIPANRSAFFRCVRLASGVGYWYVTLSSI